MGHNSRPFDCEVASDRVMHSPQEWAEYVERWIETTERRRRILELESKIRPLTATEMIDLHQFTADVRDGRAAVAIAKKRAAAARGK